MRYRLKVERYHIKKAIYAQQVVERLYLMEVKEWDIDESVLQEHLEKARMLQKQEDVQISIGADGTVTVERRLDYDYTRAIAAYSPLKNKQNAERNED